MSFGHRAIHTKTNYWLILSGLAGGLLEQRTSRLPKEKTEAQVHLPLKMSSFITINQTMHNNNYKTYDFAAAVLFKEHVSDLKQDREPYASGRAILSSFVFSLSLTSFLCRFSASFCIFLSAIRNHQRPTAINDSNK